MKLLLILITALILGCSESEDSPVTTILEGQWSSICVDQSLGLSGQTGSNTIVTTYRSNSIETIVNTYVDSGCTQLSSTVEASQSSLFVSPGQAPKSFSVGGVFKTSNGVDATEIDVVDVDGNTQLNIFLLQNNNSTLYFGVPLCLINNPSCGLRPTEINYALPHAKVN